MEIYAKRHSLFQNKYNEIRKKYKLIGALRLVAFIAIVYCFYLSVSRADYQYLYVTGGLVLVFLIFLRIHASYSWKMRYAEALMQINQEEDQFLKRIIGSLKMELNSIHLIIPTPLTWIFLDQNPSINTSIERLLIKEKNI